jgi:hypothetical protein
MVSDDELKDRFSHHPPTEEHIAKAHAEIRHDCLGMALKFNEMLPEGRDKALAFTKLEEVMYHANAAIAKAQRVGA